MSLWRVKKCHPCLGWKLVLTQQLRIFINKGKLLKALNHWDQLPWKPAWTEFGILNSTSRLQWNYRRLNLISQGQYLTLSCLWSETSGEIKELQSPSKLANIWGGCLQKFYALGNIVGYLAFFSSGYFLCLIIKILHQWG